MPNEKHVYRKNYLTNVIFRIDFAPILEIGDEPKEFQKRIMEQFPVLEPVVTQSLNVTVNENPSAPLTEHTSSTVWKFHNDTGYQCHLAKDSLILLTTEYVNFTSFKEKLSLILTSFFDVYKTVSINRIGLRYINEINLEGKDFLTWEGFIQPPLISNLSFSLGGVLRRAMQRLEFKLDDENTLALAVGMFNPVYPNDIISKDFVIDIDCYSTSIVAEKERIITKVTEYNDTITETFEASIDEGLRTLMNAKVA